MKRSAVKREQARLLQLLHIGFRQPTPCSRYAPLRSAPRSLQARRLRSQSLNSFFRQTPKERQKQAALIKFPAKPLTSLKTHGGHSFLAAIVPSIIFQFRTTPILLDGSKHND